MMCQDMIEQSEGTRCSFPCRSMTRACMIPRFTRASLSSPLVRRKKEKEDHRVRCLHNFAWMVGQIYGPSLPICPWASVVWEWKGGRRNWTRKKKKRWRCFTFYSHMLVPTQRWGFTMREIWKRKYNGWLLASEHSSMTIVFLGVVGRYHTR